MGNEIRSFRDLIAWQKAMDLCQQVYVLSRCFPDDERFGLTAQLRRAAVSVPSNIAEGYGRGRKQDYLRFLNVALGSLFEVETQLILAARLRFTNPDAVGPVVESAREVDRILWGLIRSLQDKQGTV